VIAGVALLAGAGVASGEIIQAGNIDLRVDARVKPRKLPKRKRAPVKLRMSSRIATRDGTPAPGLRRAVVDFDVQGDVYTKGLARCRVGQIEDVGSALARKRCRRAQVGRGTFRVGLDLPDSDPFEVTGPLLVFNGKPRGRRPVALAHGSLPAPAAGVDTTFVATGVIGKAPGSVYGRRVRLRVPEIAGGAGLLTGVKLRINRRWRHRGKRRSYVVARCAAGNFVFRGDLVFSDGTHANGSLIRGCRRR
jgi:hypothetical protein